jgi:hypothetical protein
VEEAEERGVVVVGEAEVEEAEEQEEVSNSSSI